MVLLGLTSMTTTFQQKLLDLEMAAINLKFEDQLDGASNFLP